MTLNLKKVVTILSLLRWRFGLKTASLCFGISFWLLDGILDTIVFHRGPFLTTMIFDVSLYDFLLRLSLLFLIFYIGFLMEQKNKKFASLEKKFKHINTDLEHIFNISVPLCVIDKHFTINRVNDSFCAYFGFKKEQILGVKCHLIWLGPHCHTPDCPISIILNGQEKNEYECSKTLADGKVVTCLVSAVPYHGPEGELLGIVENFIDLTLRKQAEETLRERESNSTELNAWKLSAPWLEVLLMNSTMFLVP